jgi:RNA polymerase sigma-70 factor (ECF subfamily)
MKKSSGESQLIVAYKKSHEVSLVGKLYAPYMNLVYGVCLKYLKDRASAQDAVMDIFEKLTTDLLKYDTPDYFKTWLYVVTKNFCLMKLRKDGSISKAIKKIADEFMENGISLHPLDELDDNPDLMPKLKECMEKLKEQQRVSIELFYYKKMCYREISEQMQLDEKKVKSAIQNGKRNLKICLET